MLSSQVSAEHVYYVAKTERGRKNPKMTQGREEWSEAIYSGRVESGPGRRRKKRRSRHDPRLDTQIPRVGKREMGRDAEGE